AAAYVAGALSLRDAARIVALRSRAWLTLAGQGAMASVPLPAERIDLTPWGDRLTIAAVNAPESVSVAGDAAAVDELLAAYPSARRIPGIDTAGHTAAVEALRGGCCYRWPKRTYRALTWTGRRSCAVAGSTCPRTPSNGRGTGWNPPATGCWTPRSRSPVPTRSSAPGGFRCVPIRGWPTTP